MSLLISEPPLQVLPTLATKIGLNEAIFLQQLHYWLQRSTTESMGCRWVYNTAEQWQASFPFWSISTIERVIKSLRDMKLITSVKLHAKQYNHTNFYTICYQELEKIDGFDSVKLRESDSFKLRESSIQENTQETSLEKKPKRENAKKLPGTWEPNESHQKIAVANRLDISAEHLKFADYHRSKGTKFADWDAAFRNWLRKATEIQKEKQPQQRQVDYI